MIIVHRHPTVVDGMKRLYFYGSLLLCLYVGFTIVYKLAVNGRQVDGYGYGFLTGSFMILAVCGYVGYRNRPVN